VKEHNFGQSIWDRCYREHLEEHIGNRFLKKKPKQPNPFPKERTIGLLRIKNLRHKIYPTLKE
jgi:hypothetical protein